MDSKRSFIGTCSNCGETKGVIRARGVQLCQICADACETHGNVRAFVEHKFRPAKGGKQRRG